MTHSEKIYRSLESVRDLERFIQNSLDDIEVVDLHCENWKQEKAKLTFKNGVSVSDVRRIIPFLHRNIRNSYTRVGGYIRFYNKEQLTPQVKQSYLTGWRYWQTRRIGPSYDEIKADPNLRKIDMSLFANQNLVKELKPIVVNIVKAELECGTGEERSFLNYYGESNPSIILDFINEMSPLTSIWDGHVLMESDERYYPILKNGVLLFWIAKSFTII